MITLVQPSKNTIATYQPTVDSMVPSLEGRWRQAAAQLQQADLRTSTWNDLQRAFQAEALGRHDLVLLWLDETEEMMLAAWESYDNISVLQEEVTSESALGHQLLREGAECWLEALGMLRDSLGQVDRDAVLAVAEEGQRLLVALQRVRLQEQDLSARFLAAWRN